MFGLTYGGSPLTDTGWIHGIFEPMDDQVPPLSTWLTPQVLALLALGLLPLALTAALKPAALPWLAWGVGLWALALLAKILLFGPLYALLASRLPGSVGAAFWGLCSALAELGLSAGFLLQLPAAVRLETALWLGLGAGLFEIAYVLGAGALSGTSSDAIADEIPADAVSLDPFVAWSAVFERSYTLVGHVCSRGLIGLGLASGLLWLLPVALGIFAAVDGFASWAQAQGWDFAEPATARRFHGRLALVSLLEAVGLGLAWALLT